MNVSDIENQASLGNWLTRRDLPEMQIIQQARWIAARSAMRVAPLWGQAMDADWAHKGDLTALTVLWSGLISAVAATCPTAEIREAAFSAVDISSTASSTASFSSSVVSSAASAAQAASSAARAASSSSSARASSSSSSSSSSASSAYASSAYASSSAATAYASSSSAAARAVLWAQVRMDAGSLEQTDQITWPPLWQDTPQWIAEAEAKMLAIWDDDPPARWDFWRRWWRGMVTGEPLDWALQQAIAEQLSVADWEDPDRCAAAIARIEEEFSKTLAKTVLDEAIAKTYYGEHVAPDPQSDLLRLMSDSQGIADDLTLAARKIANALKILQDDTSQQYGALDFAIDLLRRALLAEPALPVELFDRCTSFCRIAQNLAAQGSVPEPKTDPKLHEVLFQIQEAALDILAADETTQAKVENRIRLGGGNPDDPAILIAGVNALSPITTPEFQRKLEEDAAEAADFTLPEEVRETARFRLFGRVVRVAKYVALGGSLLIAGTIKSKDFIEAVQFIQKQEAYKAIIKRILEWLGLGG